MGSNERRGNFQTNKNLKKRKKDKNIIVRKVNHG